MMHILLLGEKISGHANGFTRKEIILLREGKLYVQAFTCKECKSVK